MQLGVGMGAMATGDRGHPTRFRKKRLQLWDTKELLGNILSDGLDAGDGAGGCSPNDHKDAGVPTLLLVEGHEEGIDMYGVQRSRLGHLLTLVLALEPISWDTEALVDGVVGLPALQFQGPRVQLFPYRRSFPGISRAFFAQGRRCTQQQFLILFIVLPKIKMDVPMDGLRLPRSPVATCLS